VWNYANELSARVFERERRFIGAYELQKYTDSATKAGLGLHSHTVQEIGQEYCRRRKQFKKVKLRWRASGGAPQPGLGSVQNRSAEVWARPGALQRPLVVPVGQLRYVGIRLAGRHLQ